MPKQDPPRRLSADEARGGEIILRSRARRAIFIAGLAGMALLALVLSTIEFGR